MCGRYTSSESVNEWKFQFAKYKSIASLFSVLINGCQNLYLTSLIIMYFSPVQKSNNYTTKHEKNLWIAYKNRVTLYNSIL